MSLPNALHTLSSAYDLPLVDLLDYANEDPHDGWDHGAGSWPTGSIWKVEGVVLYALIRALKPASVLELGTWHGCSATHMLEAVKRNDNGAKVTSVDNHYQAQSQGGAAIGGMIPDPLRDCWVYENADILEFMQAEQGHYDFIFEDGFHDPAQVEAVWREGQRVLSPGGVMVSHDALHHLVGNDVQAGMMAAGISDPLLLKIAPSDCGLAVWKREGTLNEPATKKPPAKRRRKASRSRKAKSNAG